MDYQNSALYMRSGPNLANAQQLIELFKQNSVFYYNMNLQQNIDKNVNKRIRKL